MTEPSRFAAGRWVVLALAVLVSRAAVWSHALPVHGDDERFAAGVEFVHQRVLGRPAGGERCLIGVPTPAAYPVHHPGYPLWIMLGVGLHLLVLPAYAALTLLSIVFSVLDVLLLYGFARRLQSRDGQSNESGAWWLALAYGLSPLAWFYAGTAMCYNAGSCVALAVAWCCWEACGGAATVPQCRSSGAAPVDPCRRANRAWRLALVCIVIGAGLRPDVILWLGPLALLTGWLRGARSAAAAVAVCAGSAAAWSVVAGWLYDFGSAADSPQLAHTLDKVLNTSVLRLGWVDGLVRNAIKLGLYVGWSASPVLALLLIGMVVRNRQTAASGAAPAGLKWFLAVWLMPAVLFNLLIHMTEPGHAIWHLAPLWVLAVQMVPRWGGRHVRSVCVAAAIVLAVQFVMYPWSAGGSPRVRLFNGTVGYLSWRGMRHIDQRGAIHRPGGYWPTRAHESPD